MTRRQIAAKLEFDYKNFPIGWEDMDFATRMKKVGYDVKVLPWIIVYHDYPGANFLRSRLRLYFEIRNRIIFHKKWSTNILQRLVSITASIFVGIGYIFVSLIYSKNLMENIKMESSRL